ncbi:MAG: cytochrome P450, partial [Candidatus Binatia bacterium]
SSSGFWYLSRYDDVEAVLRNRDLGRNFRDFLQAQYGDGPLLHRFQSSMLYLDPPDHQRLRSLVTRAFNAKRVADMEPRIHAIADVLIDAMQAKGHAELVADFAHPLPATVISEMIGIPLEDRDLLRAWTEDLARGLEFMVTPEQAEAGNRAADGMTDYMLRLIDRRRCDPGDDLIDALIAAEEAGGRLSDEELVTICALLFVAGHETTKSLIASTVLALLRSPSERALLAERPDLAPGVVQEVLRYESPVQMTARRAVSEIRIGGRDIGAGDVVVLLLGAANRDPSHYDDPDRLDVRRDGRPPLAFGGGIHFCLGAALAKAETEIAVNALLRRLLAMELATERIAWRPTATLRGVQCLEVGF